MLSRASTPRCLAARSSEHSLPFLQSLYRLQHRVFHARAEVSDRTAHNAFQSRTFDSDVSFFEEPLPDEIQTRLARIVASAPRGQAYRAIDVGAGTGCLVPHLQAAGWSDILAVDLSQEMLAVLRRRYPDTSTLGNDGGVRTWHGDIIDLPGHQGRAHAILMNAVYGNISDQRAALLNCISLLLPEGHIVISHPLGRGWHDDFHKQNPKLCPHHLPDRQSLEASIKDLPLEVSSFVDEPELYCAALRIPPNYTFPGAPVRLKGEVVHGFQRGSKAMGVPTANIAPGPLEEQLKAMNRGVYFGWAKLMQPQSEADGEVVKMVMNVGIRPTIQDGSNMTVEVHMMHSFSDDFYGREVRVIAAGYVRPEMKMASLEALITRIKTDVSIASTQLDSEALSALRNDSFFL